MILCRMPTFEHPRHLIDENVVEAERRVVPEDSDEVLDEFHVHILQTATVQFKHQSHRVSVLFPGEGHTKYNNSGIYEQVSKFYPSYFLIPFKPLELVEDEFFHLIHEFLGLSVRPHPEDQDSLAVLVAAVVEQSPSLLELVPQFCVLDICNRK